MPDFTLDTKSPRLKDIPAKQYHAAAGQPYLSSHLLQMFARCPAEFHDRVTNGHADVDTTAFLIGRAFHVFFLQPTLFDDLYAVGGPINPKTGRPFGTETKAFAAWAAEQAPRDVLSQEQYELVYAMHLDGLSQHDTACGLLRDATCERVIRCNINDIPCQAMFDALSPVHGLIDLKTCGNLDWFEADARRFGYDLQMAVYRRVLIESGVATGNVPVHIIAVEKAYPFRCGVWRVDDYSLDAANDRIDMLMAEMNNCRTTGVWPTRYEDERELRFQ